MLHADHMAIHMLIAGSKKLSMGVVASMIPHHLTMLPIREDLRTFVPLNSDMDPWSGVFSPQVLHSKVNRIWQVGFGGER